MKIRILTIGDIVGTPGMRFLKTVLPKFIEERSIDLVVANAENAVAGSGLNPNVVRDLKKLGVDLITTGDHVWRRREIIPVLEKDRNIIRAANFKADAPGRGWAVVTTRNGVDVGVVHVLGRVFMQPVACPFDAVDAAIKDLSARVKVIVVEFHAEATSEKKAMGYHCDGRTSVVFGTHTHVPTADLEISSQGTATISDLGMTGPYHSVLGRKVERVLHRFKTGLPTPFDVAGDDDDVRAAMALFVVDSQSGQTLEAERIELRQADIDS